MFAGQTRSGSKAVAGIRQELIVSVPTAGSARRAIGLGVVNQLFSLAAIEPRQLAIGARRGSRRYHWHGAALNARKTTTLLVQHPAAATTCCAHVLEESSAKSRERQQLLPLKPELAKSSQRLGLG